MGSKGASAPAPMQPPPEVPKEATLSEEDKRAQANEERRQRLMRGRQESILTSPLGTPTPQTSRRGIMGG